MELANTDGNSFPKAKVIIKNNFYIDDCLCSVPSLEDAKRTVLELSELLERGGFNTNKWTANNTSLVKSIKSPGPTWVPSLDIFKVS